MISNGEKWHYIRVKKLPPLLRGITSKEHDEFYCLNCIYSFATGKNHESHKIVCKNKDFLNVLMPSENTKTLKFNQYQNSDKRLFITYADFECLIEKIVGCKNSFKNSSTTKVSEHIKSGFSMPTISSF